MARQAAAMNVWHLRQLEPKRRYAMLVVVALDHMAMRSDQILEMHNGVIDLYFKKAERKHVGAFQEAATLVCPHDVDCFESFGNAYAQFRRYVPQFLDTFEFRASPACTDLLRAIGL
jgi:hypothetical protein